MSQSTSNVRFWPIAKMRTDAVLGGKLPSSLRLVKSVYVAMRTELIYVLGIFATRVLSIGTMTGWGQSRRLVTMPWKKWSDSGRQIS